jgi:hypothetical protein
MVHLTRQCPPLAISVPLHRKPLLILSILLITHFFGANTVRKYVDIDESTKFKIFSRPALLRKRHAMQAPNIPSMLVLDDVLDKVWVKCWEYKLLITSKLLSLEM